MIFTESQPQNTCTMLTYIRILYSERIEPDRYMVLLSFISFRLCEDEFPFVSERHLYIVFTLYQIDLILLNFLVSCLIHPTHHHRKTYTDNKWTSSTQTLSLSHTLKISFCVILNTRADCRFLSIYCKISAYRIAIWPILITLQSKRSRRTMISISHVSPAQSKIFY